MSQYGHLTNKKIAKLRRFVNTAGGGIFTTKTRKRLFGILGQAGPGRKKHDFWYDVRKRIKNALTDLELFIEMASKNNVNQVMTEETLRPVVDTLLWHPVVYHADPDLKRAEIAQLFIQAGFDYLRSMKASHVTSSHLRTINEAIDLSHYLVEAFKPEKDRRYITPTGAF